MTAAAPAGATTTSETGFESVPSGFWIWRVTLPAAATSLGLMVAVQASEEAQVVARPLPFTRSVEPGPGLDTAKFSPVASSVKESSSFAVTLEGAIASIVAAVAIATVAEPDCAGSSWLVAVTVIALGEGAWAGAVKTPVELTDPQGAAGQETLQVTAWFEEPVTMAVNSASPEGAMNAAAGATLTVRRARISASAVADWLVSAALVAVMTIGFVAGIAAGAR
jgi:hypothetical protein